ncbi:ribosomal protein S10 [Rozella allomycis CSF55]|uniref:Plectin/S10 domain-containing protein n=1 Tax=Rozella allomycis (strain CSF55) TaxID=988480 RepID=A0A075AUY4_ROZAC|nr:Plectin/S10 domain-containing protein [Rozella allomycis CSF55]RKP20252.1 ribosomal protein S10 [Rozella allomycis CSF55]|eukprot:EPZ32527.1 Plectin/S10 domain-containing protein [Rozella allomycis CSF55]
MLIPKQNRRAIYEYLFREGVLVAKKDYNAPKHMELDVPNLQVIKACQSLKSNEYVREVFSWQHYYFFLTDAGIEFLRQYLHLPAEIVPATLKKTAPIQRLGERPQGRREGNEDYRKGEKSVPPSADYKAEFRGGYGRGRATSNQ